MKRLLVHRCLPFLLIALSGGRAALAQTPSTPLSAEAQARMGQQIAALARDKAARTPAQQKMDSQLIFAAREAATGQAHPGAPMLRSAVKVSKSGRVEVDIKGKITASLLTAVAAEGGTVVNSHPESDALRVRLPLAAVETVAGHADVRFIRRAEQPEFNAGRVNSQGDATHLGPQARQIYGTTGAGVKVGVLSDSIEDNAGSKPASLASGDIDPNNTFIIGGQAGSGEGEGLAMMEIIHDLAPGAPLYFATGNGGPAQMAANIRALAAQGCRVIVDDITYSGESPFQDDTISLAVNEVTAQGVLYFSSARNSGNFDQGTSSVWEGDFADGGDASAFSGQGARFHAFPVPGGSPTIYNLIEDTGRGGGITLFWNDPLGKSANDYDVFEVDPLGNIFQAGGDVQNGTQDPFESIKECLPGDYVVVVKASGANRFLHLEVGRLKLKTGTPGCVRGHNAATALGAFSVAAVPAAAAQNAGDPVGPYPNAFSASVRTETFSSDGPRRKFYDPAGNAYTPGNLTSTGGILFAKPDFAAADGVATTLPLNQGLNPFFGTSAAAPHAAAICALLLSAHPALSPTLVTAILKNGSVQLTSNGPGGRDAGSGVLLATNVLQSAINRTPKDFNHDGTSDLIWQNASTGQRDVWTIQNGQVFQNVRFATIPVAWKIAGMGDFNGDNQSDIVWQNTTTGQRDIWLMYGIQQQGIAALGTIPVAWQIAATGDFNGDGKTDLLWQNTTTGERNLWIMNGTALAQVVNLGAIPTVWQIAAAGDLDGDLTADIVWQNTSTGERDIWYMRNAQVYKIALLANIPVQWQIAGIADFNHDGRNDLIWQNTTSGQRDFWLYTNAGLQIRSLGTVPPVWSIATH